MFPQDTGLDQEANDAAARVAGVGGDREDRYKRSPHLYGVIPSCPAVWQQCCIVGDIDMVILHIKSASGMLAATDVIETFSA